MIAGVGRTVNLSSTGVLVASSDKMTDGMRLRLTIRMAHAIKRDHAAAIGYLWQSGAGGGERLRGRAGTLSVPDHET